MVYPKTPFPHNYLADQELANITKALNLEDGMRESEKKTNKSENYHWMVYKQVK